MDAKAEVKHVAFLDFLRGMLEHTLSLTTNSILRKETTHGHSALVELVKEATLVPLHTQTSQPVPAYSLQASDDVKKSV